MNGIWDGVELIRRANRSQYAKRNPYSQAIDSGHHQVAFRPSHELSFLMLRVRITLTKKSEWCALSTNHERFEYWRSCSKEPNRLFACPCFVQFNKNVYSSIYWFFWYYYLPFFSSSFSLVNLTSLSVVIKTVNLLICQYHLGVIVNKEEWVPSGKRLFIKRSFCNCLLSLEWQKCSLIFSSSSFVDEIDYAGQRSGKKNVHFMG